MSLIPVNTTPLGDASNEQELVHLRCVLGLYVSIMITGMVVAMITRPRTKSASFAIGTVGALMMTFFMFIQTCFISINSTLHDQSDDIRMITEIALSDDGQEFADRQKALEERFPKLWELSHEERANVLANFIHYQTVFAIPIPIVVGIGIASIFCLLPCTLGTVYSSNLIQQKVSWWQFFPRSIGVRMATGRCLRDDLFGHHYRYDSEINWAL